MMEGRFHFKYTYDSIIIEGKRKRINILIKIGFNSYNLAKYVRKGIICGLLFDIMLKSTCHSKQSSLMYWELRRLVILEHFL